MKVYNHNKGIEMLHLPKIINSKIIKDTVPMFLNNSKPAMVFYTYISGQILNQRKVAEELDFDIRTKDMYCECGTNKYCYEPAGHVSTGDLNIIRNASLRLLIEKEPSYWEQNGIINDVRMLYNQVSTKMVGVDIRAFNEWENVVNHCIERRISMGDSRDISE